MRPFLFITLLLGGLSLAAAQTPSTESEIRAGLQASSDAWNRGDLKGHLAIYAEDVTSIGAAGPRHGVARIEEDFAKKYFKDGRPKQTLGFSEITVRPLGPDAALAIGRWTLSGGGEPEQTGWFSLVWLRTAQGWKVIHDHSS
jgi:uncharacterized protein (TIGR02246 family)